MMEILLFSQQIQNFFLILHNEADEQYEKMQFLSSILSIYQSKKQKMDPKQIELISFWYSIQ